jgi:DNA-directed RNA polymerase specialized sigma24 family protein
MAFSGLWLIALPHVRACLVVFLGDVDEVNDAVQEVALLAWRKAPLEAAPSGFVSYTLGCARRVALATRRKMRDKRLLFLSPEAATAICDARDARLVEESEVHLTMLAALRGCLSELKPHQQELLVVRYSSAGATGLHELAARQNIRVEALYKKLERLRVALRHSLARRLMCEETLNS